MEFSEFRINPEDFAAHREAAHASNNPILRETDTGFSILKRNRAGERVETGIPKDSLFWLAGGFYDTSVEFPVPFAGVNYFNYDVGGSGVQTNLFFAGAILLFNMTDERLLRVGWNVEPR